MLIVEPKPDYLSVSSVQQQNLQQTEIANGFLLEPKATMLNFFGLNQYYQMEVQQHHPMYRERLHSTRQWHHCLRKTHQYWDLLVVCICNHSHDVSFVNEKQMQNTFEKIIQLRLYIQIIHVPHPHIYALHISSDGRYSKFLIDSIQIRYTVNIDLYRYIIDTILSHTHLINI